MKKALSLVLAVVLAFGITTVAFAATEKITGYDDTKELFVDLTAATATDAFDGALLGTECYDSFGPADGVNVFTKKIYLNPNAFTGESGNLDPDDGLTTNDLDKGKVKVRLDANTNAKKVIDSVSLKQAKLNTVSGVANGTGKASDPVTFSYIEVKFKNPYVAVSNVDFDFEVVVTMNGKKINAFKFEGTYELNVDKDIDEDQEEIELGENVVADPGVLVRGIKVDGGENVYATINMASNKKYYFAAYNEIRDEDMDLLDKYSQIDSILYIDQVNMKFAGNYIEFDFADKFFVYNDEGIYIGMSDEKLPFSSKYYLATERIEIAGSEEPTEPEPEGETPEPAPEGETPSVPNENNNPDTGVNGFVNVAVVAGLVSLAAAGAVSMKKK